LRYAINMANSNADLSNRIVFQPGLTGTITLTQGKLVVNKALAILGPGADRLTVSGNHQSGVLDIEAPASQTVFVSDVTIAEGTGAGQAEFGLLAGGGLFNATAMLVLERTLFARNTLPPDHWSGSALFNWHGIATLNDSIITNNQAGGATIGNEGTMAIHASTVSANQAGLSITNSSFATMTLDHSTIADNEGYVVNLGTLTMTACTVTGNSGFYGALENVYRATVTDSTFLNNHGGTWCGGIANTAGDLTISGSTLAGNTAGYGGGGVYINGGNVNITNSTISGNAVFFWGGGIYCDAGFLQMTSSTIAFNATTLPFHDPDFGGGGVYAEARRVVLRNTLVADNTTVDNGPDVLGSVLSLGYNLVGQSDGSSGWGATDRTGISSAPIDPRLGPLQDNGGPTPTHALLGGSPALQAGDPTLIDSLDQRGSARGLGGPYFIPSDIGAFSAASATQFLVLAPSSALVGEPFAVTVVALDRWGNVASTYTGTVHFSSTDLFAVLPDDTAFSPDDAGVHTFNPTFPR
jgi:hypothetical protein